MKTTTKNIIVLAILLLLVIIISINRADHGLIPDDRFVLEDYMGRWYEIARYDHRFERGCDCVYAEYALTNGGYVDVYNYCRERPESSIRGKAYLTNTPGALKVQFFPIIKSDYVVTYYDDVNGLAIVSSGKNYLWFLAREEKITEKDVLLLEEVAVSQGFDIEKLLYLGGC